MNKIYAQVLREKKSGREDKEARAWGSLARRISCSALTTEGRGNENLYGSGIKPFWKAQHHGGNPSLRLFFLKSSPPLREIQYLKGHLLFEGKPFPPGELREIMSRG